MKKQMTKITPPSTTLVEPPPPPVVGRDGLERLVVMTTGVPAVDKLGERYVDALDEFRGAQQELRRLTARNAPDRARAADADEFAKARASGAPDPGPVNHQKLLKDVAEATRQTDGLRRFLENAGAEYVEALNANRDKIEALALASRGKVATVNAKRITDLAGSLTEMHHCNELAAWIQSGARRPKRGHIAPSVVVNGAKISVPDLLDVLAAYVARPSALEVEEAPARGFHEDGDDPALDDGSGPRRRRGRGSTFTSTLDDGRGDPPPAA